MIKKTTILPLGTFEWFSTAVTISPLSILDQEKSIETGEEMYKAYYSRILRYFAFRIFDKEEAEDLAQSVFLKIFRSLKSGMWGGVGGVAYIFVVARNTLIDYFRAKRHTTIVSNELVDAYGVSEDSSCGSILSRGRTEIINTAVSGLRKDEAEAVSFRFLSDMEYSAIALLMGKKECTIRQLVYRGLQNLKVNKELQLL